MDYVSGHSRTMLFADPRAVTAARVLRVLGPVGIASGQHARIFPAGKPTALLAALLLRPNTVVPAERLKAAVWNRDPHLPPNAALHTCVRRLRQMLHAEGLPYDVVQSVAGGYRVDADPTTCDLLRFRALVTAALDGTDPRAQAGLLREALREWRGPLLANVDSDLLHRDEVPRLIEERLAACERVIDIELTLGRCGEVLGELWELTRAHPARERFWEQLIEALYRTGRQVEALSEYRGVKGHLRDHLGVDPGPALQRLELAILRGDRLAADSEPPAATRAVRAPLPAPPRPAPSFVGRADLVADLSAALAGPSRSPGPLTVVLSGPPGIGKTALALHLADVLRDHFAGGRLAVRATHPDGSPRPVDDLRAELTATDVTGPRLLILDDVVDAETARELTAAGPGDATVVTSRLSLVALVATHGAQVRRPGPLTPAESAAFLTDVLGGQRVALENDAAARLAAVCEHYPLALRIASTRLLTRPLLSIADYVAWLKEDPVARLTVGQDSRLAIAGVFGAALHRIEPALATAFLRLGAAPLGAAGFSADDCGAVLAGRPGSPEETLHRLADAGFLEEGKPGQFHLHGLLRLYAAASNRPPAGDLP
jgi:DNA-binding SARP family transcriptional activator